MRVCALKLSYQIVLNEWNSWLLSHARNTSAPALDFVNIRYAQTDAQLGVAPLLRCSGARLLCYVACDVLRGTCIALLMCGSSALWVRSQSSLRRWSDIVSHGVSRVPFATKRIFEYKILNSFGFKCVSVAIISYGLSELSLTLMSACIKVTATSTPTLV